MKSCRAGRAERFGVAANIVVIRPLPAAPEIAFCNAFGLSDQHRLAILAWNGSISLYYPCRKALSGRDCCFDIAVLVY